LTDVTGSTQASVFTGSDTEGAFTYQSAQGETFGQSLSKFDQMYTERQTKRQSDQQALILAERAANQATLQKEVSALESRAGSNMTRRSVTRPSSLLTSEYSALLSKGETLG
jgi:hypothetical protein